MDGGRGLRRLELSYEKIIDAALIFNRQVRKGETLERVKNGAEL